MVNKSELIKEIIKISNLKIKELPIKEARKVRLSELRVDAVLEHMKIAIEKFLKNGEIVNLQGLGQFIPKEKKERKAMNPRTKEEIIVLSHKVVNFKVSSTLKGRVK
jgi:DNA-binding protein HU-beta